VKTDVIHPNIYMKWLVSGLFLLCVLFASIASPKVAAQDAVGVNAVRFGLNGSKTRFVIDTKEKITPNIILLGNPNRLVVDVPDGRWMVKKNAPVMGVVSKYRHGQFKPGTFRLVLDLNDTAVVDKVFHLPPSKGYGYRTVIDMKTVAYSKFNAAVLKSKKEAAARQPKMAQTTSAPRIQKKRSNKPKGKRVVVIDPGHGGHDPGSLGSKGVNEETVTLQIAREMKRELEKSGQFIVYLTRNSDRFIELRQRFKIARAKDADLFISVHADSIDNPKPSGGTIYSLSEKTSDRETANLVRRENAVDVLGGIDVEVESKEVLPILLDLAMREKMNASAQFAEILLPEMRKTVNMRKTGHRYGPWIVLKDPIVPAVLLETGFISNKRDERFIKSKDGQRKIARAVHRGVVKYFAKLAENGR